MTQQQKSYNNKVSLNKQMKKIKYYLWKLDVQEENATQPPWKQDVQDNTASQPPSKEDVEDDTTAKPPWK